MPPTKAYRTGDVSRTREYLTELDALPYHDEDLRPKALLLTALTEVQAGQEAQLRKRLEDFVQRYPETPLMPYASSLLTALRAGRTLTTPPLLTRPVTGSTEGISETEGLPRPSPQPQREKSSASCSSTPRGAYRATRCTSR